MFKIFANAFKVKDIRKKIFYVLFILAVYRFGTAIPLPGIDVQAWRAMVKGADASGALTLQTLLGGGVGTLFEMGIGPYITSSIIMQLLTVAIPKLEQLQKEGQQGRDKINRATRVVAVGLAILQGIGTVFKLSHQTTYTPDFQLVTMSLFKYNNILVYATAVTCLVAGTIFIMWLSELLTERGFGNGSSFIIFANILSGLPGQLMRLGSMLTSDINAAKIAMAIFVLVMFLAVIVFAIIIQDGERRVPVQYSKKMVGRQLVGGQSSYIPLKVNIAGVMSIIFAISLIQFPTVINGFINNPILQKIIQMLQLSHITELTIPGTDRYIPLPIGAILYVILIFCFTFFYTSFAINPNEMAENIKKNGGFIPGIRPGKPTSDFIQKTVDNLSWIGATFYAVIALAPVIFELILKVPVGFGGTTLLIVSSVALDIIKQLESLLLMRHYKGFLN